jgi:hypothetical protein
MGNRSQSLKCRCLVNCHDRRKTKLQCNAMLSRETMLLVYETNNGPYEVLGAGICNLIGRHRPKKIYAIKEPIFKPSMLCQVVEYKDVPTCRTAAVMLQELAGGGARGTNSSGAAVDGSHLLAHRRNSRRNSLEFVWISPRSFCQSVQENL